MLAVKRLFLLLAFGLAVVLLIAAFKPYEYKATIEVKTIPDIAGQTFLTWQGSLTGAELLKRKADTVFLMSMTREGQKDLYHWQMLGVRDSLTAIELSIKADDLSLLEKAKGLFFDTKFKAFSTEQVKDFYEKLSQHLESFRLSKVEKSEIPPSFCAYVSIENEQILKARGMMENYSLLSSFILENDLTPAGRPFVEVVEWDRENNALLYNFCYPIESQEELPENEEIEYKTIAAKPALKMTFNGNYIHSDRAWYGLLHYAKLKGIALDPNPIEIFYNNPNMGGDALKWRADIFMPLANK